jgi:hypothetical protein
MTAKGDDLPDSPNALQHHDLLVTAQLNILNNRAHPIQARALVDIRSSMNFMTTLALQALATVKSTVRTTIGQSY